MRGRGGDFNMRGGRGGYQGRGRGFGGRMNNGMNRHFKPNPKPFIPHVTFDFVQAEQAFPRVDSLKNQDDNTFSEALDRRIQDLTVPANEQAHLQTVVSDVQTILDNLAKTPGDFDSCQFDEIKPVGAFKNETLCMSNKLVAEICVVLKTLPTREAVTSLANKVTDEYKKTATEFTGVQLSTNESGFELFVAASSASTVAVAVQVLVTTQYQNLRKLDPTLHLDNKICMQSLNSVKHARWFEENAANPTIRAIIRLMRDLQIRFEGLQPLTPWIIDLLSWYATMKNPKREALPLPVAFKRVFQLLSAGFFLPGSAGIIDPCEHSPSRVHTTMTLDQQDQVCYTFQTLLRILAHKGGLRQILGLEGNADIATAPSVWAGVVVIPSSKAYEPAKESEPQSEEPKEEMEEQSAASEPTSEPKMEQN